MPTTLDHDLRRVFPQLAQFHSTKELEDSAVYALVRREVERVLDSVISEDFAAPENTVARSFIRAVAWNIERGKSLPQIIRALNTHPLLAKSDLLLLTELDYGMARTGNAHIAREIAEALRMNYVFAPCYLALNKGSGLEAEAAGENTQSLHGNAVLARFPLHRAHSFALPNGKDKMRGKEKRLGCQRAVIADMQHPMAGQLRVVSLHLDAHSTQNHRYQQMRLLLDHLKDLRPRVPVVIGGDWNTSTYNSRRALYSILGYARRVAMGVGNVIENHYPYPERWFERKLFRELEERGYNYRDLNEPGACTLHYDVSDRATNVNLGDWIPQWCFHFINWALSAHGGRCSLKLDWFAGKDVRSAPERRPQVINSKTFGDASPPSDHDPILLDFVLQN
ncbi:MAG: hypothetical protein H0V88_11325 [Pyrinomonadaceae bacterium]|nr:hypothetical protein [Pyrinomonadaceae bacterium]